MLHSILRSALEHYLHSTPDFRGKWRILRAFAPLIDGIPVRTRFPEVVLTLAVTDRTNQLCVLGKHEPTVATAVAKLLPGECFVDIGANCGLYTIMASKKVGADGVVISFEPCLQTFLVLEENLRLNGTKNVHANNCAVSDMPGPAQFDMSTVGHTGRYAMALSDSAQASVVDCVRIENGDRFSQYIGNRSTMIKIDVEGFEVSVLKGIVGLLSRAETHTVVVEVDDKNLRKYGGSAHELYHIMDGFGFVPSTNLRLDEHYDEVFVRS